ncbi:MAG: HAD hydrolase family protein [Burkholderiales bacterium]|nr:HAD hydrolase family protein [Burkholderiales bacterium]
MKKEVSEKAKVIEAVLFDVDGVMTDGKIYCSENGETLKAFNAADGLGIKLLQDFEIRTGVSSGRDSAALRYRLNELNIQHLYLGVEEKLNAFENFLEQTGLKPDVVAFIGDDLPDLPILTRCGLSIGPSNSSSEVLSRVDYVTVHPGGEGSIREVVEIILKAKGFWDSYIKDLC